MKQHTKLIAAVIAAAASFALGRPVVIETGSDLTARQWPSGSDLQLRPGAVLLIDRPVRFAGELSIDLKGGALKNRQAGRASIFETRPGHRLNVSNGQLIGATSLDKSLQWVANRGLTMWGGAATFRNIQVADGQGVQIESCDSFWWIGGGTGKATTYSYALYAGNALTNSQAKNVQVEACTFTVGRREAAVRLMGGAGNFIGCTFNADTSDGKKHGKPAFQPRHWDGTIVACTFINSIDAGPLAPSINAAYFEYAQKTPTRLRFEGCKLTGWLQAAGNTQVTIKRMQVIGRDTRGSGGSAPFNQVSQSYKGQTAKPSGTIAETAVKAFKQFASTGWTIAEGNTLEGKPVK